jgi:hypothetical protein
MKRKRNLCTHYYKFWLVSNLSVLKDKFPPSLITLGVKVRLIVAINVWLITVCSFERENHTPMETVTTANLRPTRELTLVLLQKATMK